MKAAHTPGTWRQADHYGAIVSDKPHPAVVYNAADMAAYGGYLVAESVRPEDRPTICAAPQMLDLLRRIVQKAGDPKCAEGHTLGAYFNEARWLVEKLDTQRQATPEPLLKPYGIAAALRGHA